MRKSLLVLVLAGALAGGAFAQSTAPSALSALSLDLATMFEGFVAGEDTDTSDKSYFALSPVFEYAVGNYSIGVRGDFVFGSVKVAKKQSVTHVGLAAIGRWYPLAQLEKLYLGAELGFDTCSLEDADDELYTGLTFALRAGWKHIMGPVFLEPSLGYVLSKTGNTDIMPVTPADWQIGLNAGFVF
jgi:hypothetical protein